MVDKLYGLHLLEKAKEGQHGELLIRELKVLTDDYRELKYIYNTEEEQLQHKEIMEKTGHKCYQCGFSTLYRDPNKKTEDTGFFRSDVKVPTSIFGIEEDGLLHEARLLHGYYDSDK